MVEELHEIIFGKNTKTASFELKNVEDEREIRDASSAVVRKTMRCSISWKIWCFFPLFQQVDVNLKETRKKFNDKIQ